ncbi:MAG: hypothetical protein JOZ72_17055 [Alphaproteobacteria bacterium]|nr:hypothetical protein [Alphaproteobacteria bacterium]
MSAAGVTLREEPFIDWRAIVAGAVLASGVSFTLLAFGSGIGLSVVSTAPTWRDSSPWLWFLSGLYLVFVALCAFGIGGYAAGRMRIRATIAETVEARFRDGMHGLFTWGLAVLIAAVLALGGAAALSRAMAPSGGTAGPTASVAGENIIASELDALFRSDRRVDTGDIEYRRAEAARILLKSSSHRGVSGDDRAYLATLAMREAGAAPDDAQMRADRAVADSRDELRRARSAAVVQAFLVAAALLVGAAVAWFSAHEGGLDRQEGVVPVWDWSFRRRRTLA